MSRRCAKCNELVEQIAFADSTVVQVCPVCHSTLRYVTNDSLDGESVYSPTQLGNFRLVEELGAGSHGMVFKAYDPELDRYVALKFPKVLAKDPRDEEPFYREARAAAQLSHEHIVRVFEVGKDANIAFIVSDYIEGKTLTEWLDENEPNFEQSVSIAIKVCSALEHAHEAGIVHRDLKPSNIMMDSDNEPKLMDFGLAWHDEGIRHDREGEILGTPAYMSPEQAFGQSASVSAASDIYSLGVILFEMLTGERPFHGDSRAVLHKVRFVDPPTLQSLNQDVPKDLCTIVTKCLDKSPDRRYHSADELSQELQRWRDGVPIKSRPISSAERMVRCCWRNPIPTALACSALLFLVVGVVASTSFARIADREAQLAAQSATLANKQRDHSKRRLIAAMDAIDHMLIRVADDEIGDIPGMNIVRRDLVDKAVTLYDQLVIDSDYEPAICLAAMASKTRLGQIEIRLGDFEKAKVVLEQAEDLSGYCEKGDRLLAERAKCLQSLALIAIRSFSNSEASDYVDQAIDLLQSAVDFQATATQNVLRSKEASRAYAICLSTRGELKRRCKDMQGAYQDIRMSASIHKALVECEPKKRNHYASAIAVGHNLANLLCEMDRYEECNSVIADMRQTHASAPNKDTPSIQSIISRTHTHLASYYRSKDKFSAASKRYRIALDVDRSLVHTYPHVRLYRVRFTRTLYDLANCLSEMGDCQKAVQLHEEALLVLSKALKSAPRNAILLSDLAYCYRNLGLAYRNADRFEEAQQSFEKSEDTWLSAIKHAQQATPKFDLGLCLTRRTLGSLAERNGNLCQAESCLRNSLQLAENLLDEYPDSERYARETESCKKCLARFLDRHQSADSLQKELIVEVATRSN